MCIYLLSSFDWNVLNAYSPKQNKGENNTAEKDNFDNMRLLQYLCKVKYQTKRNVGLIILNDIIFCNGIINKVILGKSTYNALISLLLNKPQIIAKEFYLDYRKDIKIHINFIEFALKFIGLRLSEKYKSQFINLIKEEPSVFEEISNNIEAKKLFLCLFPICVDEASKLFFDAISLVQPHPWKIGRASCRERVYVLV